MGFFSNFFRGAAKVIGKIAPVVKKVGQFVRDNHQHIAPLAHGLAVASGSQTAQKITGLGLAASKTLALRQNLDKINSQAAQQAAAGGSGVFNQMTGSMGIRPNEPRRLLGA